MVHLILIIDIDKEHTKILKSETCAKVAAILSTKRINLKIYSNKTVFVPENKYNMTEKDKTLKKICIFSIYH